MFTSAYDRLCNEMLADTPNMMYWFRSGPYRGREDIERRHLIGLDQIDKFFDWYEQNPEYKTWVTPDGEVAAEVPFDVMFGTVPVRGYVDDILVDPATGDLIVVDDKTGNQPGKPMQLSVYPAALRKKWPDMPPITSAWFWMAKNGKPTKPITDFTTEEELTRLFEQLDANIEAGRFDPDPEKSKCRFCDVQTSCEFSASW